MITHAPNDLSALDDVRLAAALATGAGDVLLGLRRRADATRRDGTALDAGASDLRRAGDAAAQSWLAGALAGARPGDSVLSEEAADDPRRLTADRVWIIDPLDGTREFGEHLEDGRWRDDFAVHVALWRRDAGLAGGAVALPGLRRGLQLGRADRPRGGRRRARSSRAGGRSGSPSAAAGRPRSRRGWPSATTSSWSRWGRPGSRSSRVLDGTVDAYLHAGGQHEWDSAAPVAVALASGFVATRLDGSTLVYNQPTPWSPDLVVCHPGLAAHLRGLLTWAGVDDVSAEHA